MKKCSIVLFALLSFNRSPSDYFRQFTSPKDLQAELSTQSGSHFSTDRFAITLFSFSQKMIAEILFGIIIMFLCLTYYFTFSILYRLILLLSRTKILSVLKVFPITKSSLSAVFKMLMLPAFGSQHLFIFLSFKCFKYILSIAPLLPYIPL